MARRYDNKGESYINCYPRLKKWINECVACHRKGYSPSIPGRINDTAKIEYIKKCAWCKSYNAEIQHR